MPLFSNDKPDSKTAKQPSFGSRALRFAFVPEFGANLRPARESFQIFVELIATIFTAFKILPPNYAAELDSQGRRLTLPAVVIGGWRNLRFSKETIPQVLIFFALLSSLLFAALALVTVAMALFGAVFINRAHAAGYYTSNAGDDIAQQWIDFLRDGSVTGDFFSAFAQPLMWAGPIQGTLISALGFYSDAILIVAAVVLFYHLAAMTVETAHEGVVMGKRANQIWAPIRLVVAIGLLVPIGGGLNSGQYIIFKVTEWGSGLASNIWSIFLGGFEAGQGVASIPEFAADVVYNTLLTEACRSAYDNHDHSGSNSVSSGDPKAANASTDETGNGGGLTASRVGNTKPEVKNSQYCGHHNFNQTSQGGSPTSQAVQSSAQSCFNTMQQSAQQSAQQYVKYFTPDDLGGSQSQQTPKYDGQVSNIVNDYMQCLAGGLPIPSLLGVFALSSEWGWLSAGAVLSAISQAESDANDLGALIPDTQAPNFAAGGDPVMKNQVAPIVWKVSKYITMIPQGGGGGGGALGSDACAGQRATLMQQAQGMQQQGNAQGHFLDRVLQVIDWLAAWNCVWVSQPDAEGQGDFVLGIEFTGDNPIAEMARLGQACINTAYDAFDIMVNLSATAGAAVAEKKAGTDAAVQAGKLPVGSLLQLGNEGAQGALTFIAGILGMIASVFFVCGILLAYYVPLIPFINFLFGALSWVLAVLEAVIALPLLAVAHLTVEGQGLPGSSAKQGYFYIFNIALRPVLMVFGLIVGLLVFYAAVSYMNLFYMMAISTAGGLATSHLFLSRLVYNAIYVIILYICANSSFKAINLLPDHAVKWMGQQPYHFAAMGEAREVAGPLMQGASQGIQAATSALQSGGWGAAQALGGGGGGKAGAGNHVLGAVQGQQQQLQQQRHTPQRSAENTPRSPNGRPNPMVAQGDKPKGDDDQETT